MYSEGTLLESRQQCRLFGHVYLDFLSIYALIKQISCNSCKSSYPNRLAYVAQLTRHSVTHEVKFSGDAFQSKGAPHEEYATGTTQGCYK
jgi:hypothetical protein